MGTAKARIPIRIVFDGAASGLRTGANVNFNGIRIGEVASVKMETRAVVASQSSTRRRCARTPRSAWNSRA